MDDYEEDPSDAYEEIEEDIEEDDFEEIDELDDGDNDGEFEEPDEFIDEVEEGEEEDSEIDDDEDGEEEPDITSFRSTRDIFKSGLFTAEERQVEYRRRGKSPSGVIDGEYNDTYLEDGAMYNDSERDWDADA